jgi:hypothetical protein
MFLATALFTITLFTTDARRAAAADRTPPELSHVRSAINSTCQKRTIITFSLLIAFSLVDLGLLFGHQVLSLTQTLDHQLVALCSSVHVTDVVCAILSAYVSLIHLNLPAVPVVVSKWLVAS